MAPVLLCCTVGKACGGSLSVVSICVLYLLYCICSVRPVCPVCLRCAAVHIVHALKSGLAQPPAANPLDDEQATLQLCNLARPTLLTSSCCGPSDPFQAFQKLSFDSLASVPPPTPCSCPYAYPPTRPGPQSIPDETRRHKLIAGLTSGRLNQPKRSLDWSCR